MKNKSTGLKKGAAGEKCPKDSIYWYSLFQYNKKARESFFQQKKRGGNVQPILKNLFGLLVFFLQGYMGEISDQCLSRGLLTPKTFLEATWV